MTYKLVMDWGSPEARAALLDQVGVREYNRLFTEHQRTASIIEVVNGHAIRPTRTRFGAVFAVGSTGRAFANLNAARGYARVITEGNDQ